LTVTALRKFAPPLIVLAVLPLSACLRVTPEATATEQELCIAWRDSQPTRSRFDTERTQAEIGRSYDVQAASCPLYPVR